jgi:hypothetical protein
MGTIKRSVSQNSGGSIVSSFVSYSRSGWLLLAQLKRTLIDYSGIIARLGWLQLAIYTIGLHLRRFERC